LLCTKNVLEIVLVWAPTLSCWTKVWVL